MPTPLHDIRRLAIALTAGPMDNPVAMIARVVELLESPGTSRWLHPLVADLRAKFGHRSRPTWRDVLRYLENHRGFLKAWEKGHAYISEGTTSPRMAKAPGAPTSWSIPPISTLADLATTLRLHPDDLGWLTNPGQAEHYLYRWHTKGRSAGHRLIEIPKPLLKIAQRAVLRQILNEIPPHEGAHGFRHGHSVRSFVQPHCGQRFVLRLDLEDFFPSIRAARVFRIFLTAGYPEVVARALTTLCSHAVPSVVLRQRLPSSPQYNRLSEPHLPQGAPSSPALANLCAFRLDCRLAGLARAAGAHYTRYADDLVFSGNADFARQSHRFEAMVHRIILEEGFHPNFRKTRSMHSSQRQRAGGIILNKKPNLSRRDFDQLKAILTNCRRHGPESQNRENHENYRERLEGTLAWHSFVNPDRGKKLQSLFEGIRWH